MAAPARSSTARSSGRVRSRARARAAALACGALLLLGLAGCTSSGGANGSAGGAKDAAGSANGAAAGAAVGGAPGRAAGVAVAAPGEAAGGGAAAQDGSAPVASTELIKTASISVRVASAGGVAKAADAADRIALAAGGSVYSDDRTAGKQAFAELTLKVPPDALSAVLSQLAALGTEQSRSSSTTDVTTQVADVGARVLSARQSLARLRALYGSATKVSDVIAIESEIAQREADLESLEAQQRSLADQTATATVHLSLHSPPHNPAAVTHHRRTGFLGGLVNGWHAFAASVTALVTVLGAMLPFLVIALLGAGIWRRLHRRARPVAPADPAPAE